MNKINCDKCEHNKICKYTANIGNIKDAYRNFHQNHIEFPFKTELVCVEFKEIQPMPRGTMYTSGGSQ